MEKRELSLSLLFEERSSVKTKILIMLIGPSASGKDTLAKELHKQLGEKGYRVVLDATRPPRAKEIDGLDYHFLSKKDFHNRHHLSISEYRNWMYGIPAREVKFSKVNICVGDIQLLAKLKDLSSLRVVPVYCSAQAHERLYRSIKREKGFRFEFIRRMLVDSYDFLNIKSYLEENFLFHISSFSSSKVSVEKEAGRILNLVNFLL